MTKEEIKKQIDDSKRVLDETHNELANSIKNDLKNFKKKTLDQI